MRPALVALALALAKVAPAAGAEGVPPDKAPAAKSPWHELAPGVQWASAADLGGDPAWAARVVLVDPQSARLTVQFDAARPDLAAWRERFPAALAVLNGSFYSEEGRTIRPTCDLVLAGRPVRGAGCRRQDALFFGARAAPPPPAPLKSVPASAATFPAATAPAPLLSACTIAAAASAPRLLAPAEFHPEEWAEALKSFPALVRACAPACTGPHYCQERSRTAALAQRRDGKLLLFASRWPAVRSEVGRFLAETLGAAEAVNLDGGPEATLALRGETPEDVIGMAGTGLPLVLVLLPPIPVP